MNGPWEDIAERLHRDEYLPAGRLTDLDKYLQSHGSDTGTTCQAARYQDRVGGIRRIRFGRTL